MRQLTILTLFFALMATTVGSTITVLINCSIAGYKMQQAMKSEKLKSAERFEFSKAEYKRLPKHDGGKEFTLDGKLYDVVHIEQDNNHYIVFAFYDGKETDIIHSFTSLFTSEEKPQSSKKIAKLLLLFEFISPVEVDYNNPVFGTSAPTLIGANAYLPFPYLSTSTPPPDASLS